MPTKKPLAPKRHRRLPTGSSPKLLASLDAIAKAEEYKPSAEAMILARIYDGEARTPWQSVPEDTAENRHDDGIRPPGGWVEDVDLERGERLLAAVLYAFQTGDREALAELDCATSLLRSVSDPESKKRLAGYVASLEVYAERLRTDPWLAENLGVIIGALAQHSHPNFRRLEPSALRAALSNVTNHGTAISTAARLAIEVRAWSPSGKPGSEEQLTRMMGRLRQAEKDVKKRL